MIATPPAALAKANAAPAKFGDFVNRRFGHAFSALKETQHVQA
jgi:hypothetical protein